MTRRSLIAVLVASAALLLAGCGGDDDALRTDRGELVPALADSDLTVRYRFVKAPENLPVLETVAGRVRDGDGPPVDFAMVVWEPAYPGRIWQPFVVGGQRAGRVGNVELVLPHATPEALETSLREVIRETASEAR